MADEHGDRKSGINFIPNIDLGHVISMATIVGGLFLQWTVMDRRITVAEEQLKQAQQQNAELKAASRDNYLELKVDVKEIKQTVSSVQQTLVVLSAQSPNNTRK